MRLARFIPHEIKSHVSCLAISISKPSANGKCSNPINSKFLMAALTRHSLSSISFKSVSPLLPFDRSAALAFLHC